MEIKKYCGNAKPFAYAVYHASDRANVEAVLKNLGTKQYPVWYESIFGRHAQKHMEKAILIILFMTPSASVDETVNAAVNFAVTKNLPIITVYLAPTVLTPAQKLELNTYQGLKKYDYENEEDFYNELYNAAVMQWTSVTPAQKRDAKQKSVLSWVAAVAVVAVILFIVLLSSVGGTVKPGTLIDDLGYTGSLSGIKEVYIYATKTMDGNKGACRPRIEDGADYLEIIETGDVLDKGDVKDIGDFAQLKNLTVLVFTGNAIGDLSPLSDLDALQYLDVSCNPVANLDGIDKMRSLKTLNIAYTDVKDISPLLNCSTLETVYVSCNMESLFAGVEEGFEIIAADHNWGEWFIAAEASYTEAGRSQRVCDTCDKSETKTIPVIDLANLGIMNLYPHIFGGVEEWGEDVLDSNYYGIYIRGVNTEYTYVFKKNGTILNCSGREYLDGDGDGLADKTHIWPDALQMGDYDPDATYTLEISDNGASNVYTIWHKYDS